MGYDFYKPIKPPTELCELALKYGTDKCPALGHFYTPFYYEFLKDKRHSIKKVLEVGIGGKINIRYTPNHIIGPSLKMWRDFFPNAQIYGADYTPRLLFQDERIETFLCDARNKDDLVKLIGKTGSDIDLFIDDADHKFSTQVDMCLNLMPLLKKDVIYCIEDITFPVRLEKALKPHYKCWYPSLQQERKVRVDRLLIVTNYD